MVDDKINVLIVDNNENFYSFITGCIIDEEKENIINLTKCTDYEDIPYYKNFDIFIICDYDNNEEKILSIIDKIRDKNQNYSSYIYIATENINSYFLKNLINKRIYGLIDKKDRDCGTLIDTIEQAKNYKKSICYINNKIHQLKNVV